MPIYEYQCKACGHHIEVLRKISDKPLRKCPDCGKPRLQRLISPPVFRLKGSGWYETDFKSDQEGRRNLAGAEKEETKVEAKPDSKPEPTPAAATPGDSSLEASKPKDDSASARKNVAVDGKAGGRSARPKAKRSKARKRGR